jgi:hypothetical protein
MSDLPTEPERKKRWSPERIALTYMGCVLTVGLVGTLLQWVGDAGAFDSGRMKMGLTNVGVFALWTTILLWIGLRL